MVKRRRQFSDFPSLHLRHEPCADLFKKSAIEFLNSCFRGLGYFGFTAMRQIGRQLRIASGPSEMMADHTLDSSSCIGMPAQFVQECGLISFKSLQIQSRCDINLALKMMIKASYARLGSFENLI